MVEGLGVTCYSLATEVAAPLAVVVVPGAMDRAGGFLRAIRHLDIAEVIAYDRRGYATSRALLPSDRLEDHVDDLLAVIGDVDGPVVVVGHSQGALIALHAAARVSTTPPSECTPAMRSIRAVGAWEPPLPWFDWYDESSQQAVHEVIRGDVEPAAIAERFMRSAVSDRLWERLPQTVRDERIAEGPALIADITASRRDDARLDLATIALPVVVGFGSQTRPHHRRSAELVASEVAGAQLVEVPGATHGVHLSHPEAFADFVRATVAAATGR